MGRLILASFGYLFLGLGFLGIFLPLLPTTPFVLLALYCFSRSHPGMKDWILRHPMLGPPVRRWRERRTVSRATVIMASGMLVTSFGISIFLSWSILWLRWGLMGGGSLLLFMVLRLPIDREDDPPPIEGD